MLIPFGVFSAAGAGGGAAAGAYELISTTLISSNTASVTFDLSAYTSTYKHIQIRALARGTATYGHATYLRFNSDTGTNYSYHNLRANGSSVASVDSTANSTTIGAFPSVTGSSGTSGSFGASIYDIVDAFSTSKNKTVRALYGMADGGSFDYYATLTSGNWRNTAAITSIYLAPETGNFVNGSRFSIYGIKG